MGKFRITKTDKRLLISINRPGGPEANLANHESWTRRAANEGAELVLFPEMGITGYWTDSRLWHVAEPVPDPSTAALEGIARDVSIVLWGISRTMAIGRRAS